MHKHTFGVVYFHTKLAIFSFRYAAAPGYLNREGAKKPFIENILKTAQHY